MITCNFCHRALILACPWMSSQASLVKRTASNASLSPLCLSSYQHCPVFLSFHAMSFAACLEQSIRGYCRSVRKSWWDHILLTVNFSGPPFVISAAAVDHSRRFLTTFPYLWPKQLISCPHPPLLALFLLPVLTTVLYDHVLKRISV